MDKNLEKYEKYKEEWMKERGLKTSDILDRLTAIVKDAESEGKFISLKEAIDCFEGETGFAGGEVYAGFNEFCKCELKESENTDESNIETAI